MSLSLAFPIEPEISFRLMSLMRNLTDAKWRSEEQLHLTLQFLGKVTDEDAIKLDKKLAEYTLKPIDLQAQGVSILNRFGRSSLHAVIKPSDRLSAYNQKVSNIAKFCSIKLEKQRFIPHITLGYLPQEFNHEKVIEWIRHHQNFMAKIECTRFHLYESIQTKHGNIYEVRATYALNED